MRASDLLGRRVVSASGEDLGTIVDLLCEADDQGRQQLAAVLAVRGPWGRLLGYEREQVRGPWLLETLARAILRRRMTTVPWPELRLGDPPGSH
jgi:sporulation protein YlmC with PRC-barrel domain